MRVGLIVPGGVDRGGRERVVPVVLWLIERLARSHEVFVFALSQEPLPSRYPLRGATVVNLGIPQERGLPGERLATALWRLLRAVEEHGPFDVLHALFGDTPGLLGTLVGRAVSVPCLVSHSGGELVARPEIGYGSALRLWPRLQVLVAMRLAAGLTAQSRGILESFQAVGHTGDEVTLGVDRALFRARPSRTSPPYRLLSVGSLNRVKDHDTLLQAFRIVVDRLGSCVSLDIVGEDTRGGAIQRLAEELGLTGVVRFHGFLPSEDVFPLYDEADLLVVTSRHESGPLVVLEAAARFLPVVGTSVGHVRDLHPRGALAVPVGDAAAAVVAGALATSILELLGDPERRAELARFANAFAREHDADETARRFLAIYDVLKRSR